MPDIIHLTHGIVEEAMGDSLANHAAPKNSAKEPPRKENPAAVALGKLGGKKGGHTRAKKLTPEQRKAIAQKAARARWEKQS